MSARIEYQTFLRWNRNIPGELGPYHTCWCPGDRKIRIVISSSTAMTDTNWRFLPCHVKILPRFHECCETCRRLSTIITAIFRSYKSPTLWSLPFPCTERHAATSFALGISGTLRSINNMTLPISRKSRPPNSCYIEFGLHQENALQIFVLFYCSLQWRHNQHDGVSNHQPPDCLLNPLFRRKSKKTPKLRVTGLCVRNSPGTVEFPAQMTSNAEKVSIWWRHHVCLPDSL